MPITFDAMVRLVRPDPPMAQGFNVVTYDLRVLTVDEALVCITCWDKQSTIAAYAQRPIQTFPNALKVTRYVNDFPPGPILAVGFSLATLARIYAEDWAGRVGDRLVIWDGNNRLSALAVRRAMGQPDEPPIGVLVGS